MIHSPPPGQPACTTSSPSTVNHALPEDLLVFAGNGELPRLVIEGARKAGVRRIGVLGFRGSTPRQTLAMADWSRIISFSSLQRFRDAIREAGFHSGILAGQISPLSFFRAAFDPEVMRILRAKSVVNAHSVFTSLIAEIEDNGTKILPSSLFLRSAIPTPGLLTATPLTPGQEADLAFGSRIAMSICDLDIGQTVVVKDGVVLAVEGFEGTDSTILRGGRIARRGAMVVKVAKHDHDMRFDIPVVGLRTLRSMQRAHCSAIAVQAGRTLLLDREKLIRAADKCGIAIVAYDSGLPSAPIF
ncbi:MAG: LpxI family protein [Kiritimatiellia bacterium]